MVRWNNVPFHWMITNAISTLTTPAIAAATNQHTTVLFVHKWRTPSYFKITLCVKLIVNKITIC